MRLENIGQNVLVDPSKIRCFSLHTKKMKRKRPVDLKQREKIKKLRAIKEPDPKVQRKVNATKSRGKSNT